MDYRLIIGGERLSGDGTFEVINPATGHPLAECPLATAETLERAIAAAREAQGPWAADESARRDALRAAAVALRQRIDPISLTLTAEQGKPVREARHEVKMMAGWFEFFAGLELKPELVSSGGARIEIRREPLGVVGAITPWNFPLALASWKLAPAFLAGNTVVLKPSPLTPLSTLAVGEALAGVLPTGVLNVVTGPEPLGSLMSSHPGFDKISFTGSIATGKAVAAAGARFMRRDTLELGGNDPAIVLEDADPELVAAGALASAFVNCGQVCSAIKRLYLPRTRLNEFVEPIVRGARALKVGDGTDREVRMGPLITDEQRQFVHDLVEDAIGHGGEVLAGGESLPGEGYFYRPTVVQVEDSRAQLVVEEQFGPVLPVIPYDDLDRAIELANDTEFGLGASVWSSDAERALEVGLQLESGTLWLNHHVTVHPGQPFGGWKMSGAGVENGLEGLREFTRLRTVFSVESS